MTFTSAKSTLQVSEEPVIKKVDIAVNAIPTFDVDRKMKSSGILVSDLLTSETAIINALIFG